MGARVIIWLASYPRSGNSFISLILHHVYGMQTHSLYFKREPTALREVLGMAPLPDSLSELDGDERLHVVKTHELPLNDGRKAIYIVRDGRDALMSYAKFLLRSSPHHQSESAVETMRQLITTDSPNHYRGWSTHVASWLRAPNTTVLAYEDLLEEPVNNVERALTNAGISMPCRGAGDPPAFPDLHAACPWFFARAVWAAGNRRSQGHSKSSFGNTMDQ
jgi:hypothetical protein